MVDGTPRRAPKGHTIFRSFKRFNKDAFLFDLSRAPFSVVYQFNNPDDAFFAWYDIMPINENHAPLRKKRVKYSQLTPWLTKDVTEATATRDRLKKGNKFEDCKNNRSETK